jgi:hypothetical protein
MIIVEEVQNKDQKGNFWNFRHNFINTTKIISAL